jgi:hypothetical protein
VLALLSLLPGLSAGLQPQEQLQMLQQLKAISGALLDADDVEEDLDDNLVLWYSFLRDSVGDADAVLAQSDLKHLLAAGSACSTAAQQLQQMGAQQQQQQQPGLLVGFQLQCIGDLDLRFSKLTINLCTQLQRLLGRLGGGDAHVPQQQQQGVGLLDWNQARSSLKLLVKALLDSRQDADGGMSIRLQLLVYYGFLQAWVAQGDVGQVLQALEALLGPGAIVQ